MPPSDPTPEPLVNEAELLARVDNDAELLRELIAIFKIEFPRHLSELREAIGRLVGRDLTLVTDPGQTAVPDSGRRTPAHQAGALSQAGRAT